MKMVNKWYKCFMTVFGMKQYNKVQIYIDTINIKVKKLCMIALLFRFNVDLRKLPVNDNF